MADTQQASIQKIIDNDLCIACGACLPVCPKNVIEPAYSSARGANEVRITDDSGCPSCPKPCGDVCPSIRPFATVTKPLSRLGPIEQVYTGYSKEFQLNGISSSGGIIREICHHYLTRNINVICLTEERADGKSIYEARLMQQLSDLNHMPGSIYHSVSFFKALDLLQRHSGPFLLVAIPCHLEGINNYIATQQPQLANKIALKLGVICGWMYSDHGIANFADAHHLNEPLLDAKYRGEDKVGKLKLRTATKTHSYDRRHFDSARDMVIFRSSFSTDVNRLRCRLCQNHINIQSDISVGDAWLPRKGKQKLSIVVTRTAAGEALIQGLHQQQSINIELGSVADIEESQSKDLVYGTTAQKLAVMLQAQGKPIMDYRFEGQPVVPDRRDKLKLQLELIKRKLLRSGSYTAYRLFYALTKIKPLLSFIMKRNH